MARIKIEYVTADKIKPYTNNAKTHPPEQIELIKNSMKEFGVVNPMGVDKEGNLVFGHGRFESMKQLGYEEFPVFRIEHLSKQQVKMLRLADNKVAESGWTDDILDFELLELSDIFNIQDFGFGFDEDEDFEIDLPSGDRDPIQNMTFTLSDEQKELVDEAIKLAKEYPLQDPAGINENSNGNALYYICEVFKNGLDS